MDGFGIACSGSFLPLKGPFLSAGVTAANLDEDGFCWGSVFLHSPLHNLTSFRMNMVGRLCD